MPNKDSLIPKANSKAGREYMKRLLETPMTLDERIDNMIRMRNTSAGPITGEVRSNTKKPRSQLAKEFELRYMLRGGRPMKELGIASGVKLGGLGLSAADALINADIGLQDVIDAPLDAINASPRLAGALIKGFFDAPRKLMDVSLAAAMGDEAALKEAAKQGVHTTANIFGANALMGGVVRGGRGTMGVNVFQGGPNKYGPEGAAKSLDHIGKGEGAQAYGWGRYDAESKGVAKSYHDQFAGRVEKAFKATDRLDVGKWWAEAEKLFPGDEGKQAAWHMLNQMKGKEDGLKYFDDVVKFQQKNNPGQKTFNYGGKEIKRQDVEAVSNLIYSKGYLYKHDIPDDDIARYIDGDAYADELPAWQQTALQKVARSRNLPDPVEDGLRVQTFIHDLSKGGGDQAGSAALAKAGIPGLKYYDGMSRGTSGGEIIDVFKEGGKWRSKIKVSNRGGTQFADPTDTFTTSMPFETKEAAEAWARSKIDTGTRNYVTWDQDVLNRMKLLERNGETFSANRPGKMGAAAAALARNRADWGDTGTDYYHASKQEIDEFIPGYNDGLVFLTDKPEFASQWLGKGKYKDRQGHAAEIERSSLADEQRYLREKIYDYDKLNKLEGEEFNAAYDAASKKFRAQTPVTPSNMHGAVYPVRTNVQKVFDPRTDYKEVEDVIRKVHGDEVVDKGMHKAGNWLIYENKAVVDALREKGYDGMRIAEDVGGAHDTLAVFDPKNVRSRFAKFDPAKRDSANILAANKAGKTGAVAASLLAHPKTGTVEVPYSQLKLPLKEVEGFDAGRVHTVGDEYVPRKPITPEEIAAKTEYITQHYGDRMDVGDLHAVAGQEFSNAKQLQGGHGYHRGTGTGAWASDQSPISAQANTIRSAEGKPVAGAYVPMSGEATDFTKTQLDIVMHGFDPKALTKKDIKAFDVAVRKQDKSFPGLTSEKFDAWAAGAGTKRYTLMKEMARGRWREKGFPDVAKARHAVTDPELLNLPGGNEAYGGQSFALMDPAGKTTPTAAMKMPHSTYQVDIAGQYMGGLHEPLPRSLMFPDWYTARREAGLPVSADNYSFMKNSLRQPTNQKWLDDIMFYLEGGEPGY
tara:strand:- start:12778 stop:16038 length:3261 start_codon:yes stop_codon:yes gene_type:complete